jgi:hypothetical protein
MWYSEVGGTKTRYEANTTLEKLDPKAETVPVVSWVRAYQVSTVAISGR